MTSQNVGFQAVIGKQTFLKSELNSMLMYVRLCIQCLIEPRSNQVIQKEVQWMTEPGEIVLSCHLMSSGAGVSWTTP